MPCIYDIDHDSKYNLGKIDKIEMLCDEYFHGELSPQEMCEFEEHIKECETCARIFESTRKYFGAIKQAEHKPKTNIAVSVMEKIITERRTVDRPRRRRRIPFGLIGAAVIVLVIALNSNLDLFNHIMMRDTDNHHVNAGTSLFENDRQRTAGGIADEYSAFSAFSSDEYGAEAIIERVEMEISAAGVPLPRGLLPTEEEEASVQMADAAIAHLPPIMEEFIVDNGFMPEDTWWSPHIDIETRIVQENDIYAFGYGEYFGFSRFRPIFYWLPAPFVDLVGTDAYLAWHASRSWEERENENVAVGFIRYFNISKEDFTRANEQLLRIWLDMGFSPEDSSRFEIYPVDLIFTFDNEAINEFFLLENSIVPEERTIDRRSPPPPNLHHDD